MKKKLSPARRKYLSVIYALDPEGYGIRSIQIAKELNVSRPSVHTMLEKLTDDGYVMKEHYGIVYLTEKGRTAGEKITAYEKEREARV